MKKIFSVVLLIFITLLTSGFAKMHNDEVLKVIQRQVPNDNFYFIRGLEREYGFNTNVRYRGIIYSDKLKEAKAFMGIQVALEDLDSLYMWEDDFKDQYENALASPRLTKIVRENAKKVLGEDIIVYIDLSEAMFLKEGVEFVEQNIGNFIPDEKVGLRVYIDIFADDITKVNIDEYKKKLFNFHQTLYKKYNINSSIDMNLRDKKYLTYDVVENSIFYIFKDEPQVKELLKKFKKKKVISSKEIGVLTDYFVSTFSNYDLPHINFQMIYEYHKEYKDIKAYYMGGKND